MAAKDYDHYCNEHHIGWSGDRPCPECWIDDVVDREREEETAEAYNLKITTMLKETKE